MSFWPCCSLSPFIETARYMYITIYIIHLNNTLSVFISIYVYKYKRYHAVTKTYEKNNESYSVQKFDVL